jgi:branched-chain amino acid transport system substrate-binding protein
MRRFLLALLLLLFPVSAGAGEGVTIPVVAPFAGRLAFLAPGVENGARLRVEELNTNGGINGSPLKVVFRNDFSTPGSAAGLAARLVADPRFPVVVGHVGSATVAAALPIYRQAGLALISPAAVTVSAVGSGPDCFRIACRSDLEAAFIVRYARQVRHFRRVAVFYAADDYGHALKNGFLRAAGEAGLAVVALASWRAGDSDFRAQLAGFRNQRPEALLIAGYARPASLIITQARSLGMECAFLGGAGLDDGVMLANPAAEGLFVTSPFPVDRKSAMVRDFVERYRSRFGIEPDWLAANTYDAVGLAAAAIGRAGADREKIRSWLAGRDCPDRAYPGITGPIYFDDRGNCRKPVYGKLLRHGRWVGAAEQLQQQP